MLPRSVVLLGLALAGPLVFAACSDAAPSTPATPVTPTVIRSFEPDAADAGPLEAAPVDAALPPAAEVSDAMAYLGSPLCQASLVGCYPDDMLNACDFPHSSADAIDADTDANVNVTPACHVVSDQTGVHTTCLRSTVAGMYGSTCSQSTECSPGYECVAGGTCRHYCCGGNSACSDNQFCDVQPVAQSPSTLVPVCLTQLTCMLLNDSTCPPSDQCAVVRDNGDTSCVAVGTAKDGDSCDKEHCARGLVCLGAVGSRRCSPLCTTVNPVQCGDGGTCVGTLPLFPNPLFGICQ